MVQADSGAIGGSTSAEFQVLVGSGEDALVACTNCDYAANVEAAEAASAAPPAAELPGKPEKIATPTQKTIDEVASFLAIDKARTLKALLYVAKDGPRAKEVVMALVRGDHELNEFALARALKAGEVALATEADVERETGAQPGFAGPVGFDPSRLFVDRDAAAVEGGVAGANETGFHVKDVWFGRDYKGELLALRVVGAGDTCPRCGGRLEAYKGIEAGHIFILGTKYSAPMGATFIDEKQQTRTLVMGCYGIGVSRLIATTIEQHHDENGMRWPMSVAPYHVHLVTLAKDDAVTSAARGLYDALERAGIEVLWDDREERPGVKFKDADLIGIPLRVTLGSKGLANGQIELKPRSEPDPKKSELVPLASAAEVITGRVRAALAGPAAAR
jgi:prolyl-tRNA synthetase